MALGLCTEEGSPTSHIAVFARGMGLPAVVGVDLPPLEPETLLAFDGETGEVYIDPSPKWWTASAAGRKSNVGAGKERPSGP